jgi:hypothetical protein
LLCVLEGMWQEVSRPISSTLWNRTDNIGWCHDPTWGDMWIWTDDIGFSLDQMYIAMCIGKTVTSSYHDHFEVLYRL